MKDDIKKYETKKLEDWETSYKVKIEKREKKLIKSINTNWIITFLILTIAGFTRYFLTPPQNIEAETKILDIILPLTIIPFFTIVFISYFIWIFLTGLLREKITFSATVMWASIITSVYFIISHYYVS